jgi:hypothetical protein
MEEEIIVRNQKDQEKRLRQFIDKQYSHMEDYCQNQIILQNCLATNHSNSNTNSISHSNIATGSGEIMIIQAIQNVQISLTRVRNDYQWLQDFIQEAINTTATATTTDTKNNHHDTKTKADDNTSFITGIFMTETTIALLQKHLQVTKRVIKTVQDKYHSNGIPMVTTGNNNSSSSSSSSSNYNPLQPTNSQEIKTIALATLRASSANLMEGIFDM